MSNNQFQVLQQASRQSELVANKLTAFDAFSSEGVPIPAYARRKEDVTWQGLTVVRHKLTGHSGEGIELVDNPQDLPNAPLYVQYIKKEQEYPSMSMSAGGLPKLWLRKLCPG
jgi:hypothetical protein